MNPTNLPPEVQQLLARPSIDISERKAALSRVVATRRDEAVMARKTSGIESVWMECEEAYLGIDDENRTEFAGAKWAKPTTMEGPLVRNTNSSDGVRSTAFVRLTSRYVDAAAAKIGEITQPVDQKVFSLTATPVPDLIAGKDDMRTVMNGGQPVMRPPDPAPAGQPDATGQPPAPVPLTVADLAKHVMEQAEDAAEKAQRRIYDWLVESGHSKEMRKVTFDAARLGSGCLKGPFPEMRKAKALTKVPGGMALQIEEKVSPAVRWVDLWNLFPDDACGEDIHGGAYILERDFLSAARLKALKNQPGYDGAAIDEVIKEGPGKCNADGSNPNERERIGKKRYEIWYFYGEITLDELGALNPSQAELMRQTRATIANAKAIPGQAAAPSEDSVFAIVTLVNDTAIRATVNPLESGSFPYHVVSWRRRVGHWAGVGVAEQVRLPQRSVNAATRALFNNAGKSAGSIIVLDGEALEPLDGNYTITPDKMFRKAAGGSMQDVRAAFAAFTIPNVTPQLMSVIDYGFKLAEEASNIPLITQGQSGQTTPDTFGATQLQNNNANQLLRDVGFAFADQITNPLVEQMYEWLLLDPDVPDEEKGDFNVNCNAAVAMIERAIQDQTIMQMGGMVANPAFGIDPKKWFAAMARTKRLNPSDFQYTEAELEKMAAAPPPPPLPVMVEQMRGQNAMQLQQAKTQAELQMDAQSAQREQEQLQSGGTTPHMAAATARIVDAKIRAQSALSIEQSRANAELSYAQTEAQMARDNAASRRQESADKRELMILEYSLKNNLTLEQVKAQLAQVAMQEQTKRELAGVDSALQASEGHQNRVVDLHKSATELAAQEHLASLTDKTPQVAPTAMEPVGRAPDGKAFEA